MNPNSLALFHAMAPEQLQSQTTRALLAALDGSRVRRDCGLSGCGDGDCGEPLDPADEAFNQAQEKLGESCKALLATRDHLPRSTKSVKKAEKKIMAY